MSIHFLWFWILALVIMKTHMFYQIKSNPCSSCKASLAASSQDMKFQLKKCRSIIFMNHQVARWQIASYEVLHLTVVNIEKNWHNHLKWEPYPLKECLYESFVQINNTVYWHCSKVLWKTEASLTSLERHLLGRFTHHSIKLLWEDAGVQRWCWSGLCMSWVMLSLSQGLWITHFTSSSLGSTQAPKSFRIHWCFFQGWNRIGPGEWTPPQKSTDDVFVHPMSITTDRILKIDCWECAKWYKSVYVIRIDS